MGSCDEGVVKVKSLYVDQEKEVEALLHIVPLRFSTAGYCERLCTVPDSAPEQLRAYFAKDDDEKHCFELSWGVLVSEDPRNSLSAYNSYPKDIARFGLSRAMKTTML